MKKVLLSLAVLLGAASAASAQSNVIKANLLSPLVKTGSFFFERKVSDNQSAQLGFFVTSYSPDDTKFSGFGLTPEYRFYVGGEALDGFYVGPYMRYQNFKLTTPSERFDQNGNIVTSEDKATLNTIGGGVAIGRQWLFGKHVTVDPFLGLGFNAGSVKVESGSEDNFDVKGGMNGFGLRTGITLGFAF